MGTGDQSEVLGRLVSRVATLEAAAGEAEAQRRSLHNQLVELRGNVGLTCFDLPYPCTHLLHRSSTFCCGCLRNQLMGLRGNVSPRYAFADAALLLSLSAVSVQGMRLCLISWNLLLVTLFVAVAASYFLHATVLLADASIDRTLGYFIIAQLCVHGLWTQPTRLSRLAAQFLRAWFVASG